MESTNKGLLLYRKFNESIIVDNHITIKPMFLLSIFEHDDIVYELSPIEEYNTLDNTISIEAGWKWCLTKDGWSQDSVILMMKSALDIGKEEYGASGIQLYSRMGEEPLVAHAATKLNIPKLVNQAAVIDFSSDESEQGSLSITLTLGEPQDIFYAGLKCSLVLESFRGSHGVTLRIVASQEHSILRSELVNKNRKGK